MLRQHDRWCSPLPHSLSHTQSVLLTGGTGYVGHSLRGSLARKGTPVTLLVQPGVSCTPRPTETVITGTLSNLPDLRPYVSQETVLLHLAGCTGKARPHTFHSVNVDGTERLLEASQRGGVRRVIFVSSVAARFPTQRDYPYAASKRKAEALVQRSGMEFDIIRPTIIMSHGSPAFLAFTKLVRGRIGFRFGSAKVMVQPIHVADAAEALADLVPGPRTNRTWDLGGPEVTALRELLERIRRTLGARSVPTIPIPLRLARGLLRLVEPILFPIIPLTAGQLSVFMFDSTVQDPLPSMAATKLRTIDQMLAPTDGL